MKPILAALILSLLSPLATLAAIKTATIEYKDGEVTCKGHLTYDDAATEPRPGVLVIPEWWGLTQYPKDRAKQLAELGYVAFVADMYGDAKTTDDPAEAGKLAGALKPNPDKFRARTKAALEAFKNTAETSKLDASKLAAIGYCFGGSAVLELARSGEHIAGVVSFHGGLASPAPAKPGELKAKVLVCNGAADAWVKPEEVAAFEKEMKDAGAQAKIINYDGAVHAFTNPDADRHKIPNVAYNEKADKESFEAMKAFFADLFKAK